MGGGGSRTTHQTTQVNRENAYDDQWIRDRLTGIDERGLEFGNWMANRQGALGREQDIRDTLQSDLAGLRSDFSGAQADLRNTQGNLGNLRSDLGGLRGDLGGLRSDFTGAQQQQLSDFAGLSGAQLQQAKDLYNLAQKEGSGVQGYRSEGGMTFIRPRGTSGLNRQSLQTQSLNV